MSREDRIRNILIKIRESISKLSKNRPLDDWEYISKFLHQPIFNPSTFEPSYKVKKWPNKSEMIELNRIAKKYTKSDTFSVSVTKSRQVGFTSSITFSSINKNYSNYLKNNSLRKILNEN